MKRMIAAVLALVLLLGAMPVTAGAASTETVYVFFQTVDSAGKAIAIDQAARDRLRNQLSFDYNQPENQRWATLGTFESAAAAAIPGKTFGTTATVEQRKAVTDELAEHDFERLKEFKGNSAYPATQLSPEVLKELKWTDLKRGNGASGCYKNDDGSEPQNIWKLDGQLTFYKASFDANLDVAKAEEAEEDAVKAAVVPADGYYLEGETIKLPIAEYPGYLFAGWKVKDASGEHYIAKSDNMQYTVGKSDVTFTAQWEKPIYVYAKVMDSSGKINVLNADGVDYNGNTTSSWVTLGKLLSESELTMTTGITVARGSELFRAVVAEIRDDNPSFKRHDRHNMGVDLKLVQWYDLFSRDGSHDGYKGMDGDVNDGNRIAYHLDGIITAYKVHFDANAEGLTVPEDTYYIAHRTVKLPAVTRAGYEFDGWKVNDNETPLPKEQSEYVVGRDDLTFTAQWTKLHTVTFDLNGGDSAAIAAQTVRHGNAVTRPGDPTRAGYRFEGWTKNGVRYDFASPVVEDFTLVAQWTYMGTLIDNILPLLPSLDDFGGVHPTLNTAEHFAYVNGYPDGTVRPQGNVTRAETAAILFRLMSEETRVASYSRVARFGDVGANQWYNVYVATLDNAGVITDSANGYFRPNDAITRGELAAMLAQFAGETAGAVSFRDTSGHWASASIAKIAALGWIEGYPDGTFRPDQTVTRAELMAMLNRALGRTPQSTNDLLNGMKTWTDNRDAAAWYYLDVQEATNSHAYADSAAGETWTALTRDPNWKQYEK